MSWSTLSFAYLHFWSSSIVTGILKFTMPSLSLKLSDIEISGIIFSILTFRLRCFVLSKDGLDLEEKELVISLSKGPSVIIIVVWYHLIHCTKNFPLRMSLVNVDKSAGNWKLGNFQTNIVWKMLLVKKDNSMRKSIFLKFLNCTEWWRILTHNLRFSYEMKWWVTVTSNFFDDFKLL